MVLRPRFLLTLAAFLIGPAAPVAESFKVGALLCLTGACAEVGTNALDGVRLAAEEIDAQGGILGRNIELRIQDTREYENTANAVTAFRTLTDEDSVQYIIGPTWTVGGMAVAPLAAKRTDIIMTSPSLGVATFNESGDHLFNTWPHDSFSTEALAALAVRKGWKKVGVLSNQGPWESAQAKAFVAEITKLGGTVAAMVEPPGESRNLKSEVLKVIGAQPDVVFLCNYTQMDVAAIELRRLGYKGPRMAILMDQTRIDNSGGALDGTLFARYPDPEQSFAGKFQKRFGRPAGIAADTGYDTLWLYKKAIETAKTVDPGVVKIALQKTTHNGASGTISFDSQGGVIKTPEIWVVKESRQVKWQDPS